MSENVIKIHISTFIYIYIYIYIYTFLVELMKEVAPDAVR